MADLQGNKGSNDSQRRGCEEGRAQETCLREPHLGDRHEGTVGWEARGWGGWLGVESLEGGM